MLQRTIINEQCADWQRKVDDPDGQRICWTLAPVASATRDQA